jgi:RNA polymerase sigma-70 factor (ECF subfamily)
MEERELIARCISGDQEAWRELVRTYDDVLLLLARTYLRSLNAPGDAAMAEEVRAGVLEMLVAHDCRILRAFRWQCSFETWLRVVVRTVCVRSFRRKRLDPKEVPPPARPEEPLDRLLSEERSRAVREALESLPDRERRVISMFLVEGKSYREISDALSLPMGTIATVLARTRQKMRDLLDSKGL